MSSGSVLEPFPRDSAPVDALCASERAYGGHAFPQHPAFGRELGESHGCAQREGAGPLHARNWTTPAVWIGRQPPN